MARVRRGFIRRCRILPPNCEKGEAKMDLAVDEFENMTWGVNVARKAGFGGGTHRRPVDDRRSVL